MSFPLSLLDSITGFEWDAGNDTKNWRKHDVAQHEIEEVFFNCPLILQPEAVHSQREKRYAALGRTDGARRLYVVFTFRGAKLRPIHAREMTPKERGKYARAKR